MRVLFYIRASCFCVCDLVCFCVLSGEEGAHPPRLFVCRVVIRCVGHLYYALTCIRSSHARTTYLATRALHSLSNTHSFTIARPLCATHAPHSRSLWLPSPRQHTSLPSSLFTHSSLSFTHLSKAERLANELRRLRQSIHTTPHRRHNNRVRSRLVREATN